MLEKFGNYKLENVSSIIGGQSGAPGAAVNIRVRGIGSVNAGNDPLIIID